MKKILLVSAAVSTLFAASAHAVTVSNLDDQAHVVVFESTPNSKVVRTLEPGAVTHVMQPAGRVSLQGSKNEVNVYANDLLVIWKNGNLQLQKRHQATGRAF